MYKPNNTLMAINANHNELKSDSSRTILYSFPKQGKGNWRVQNDVVMGGRSSSLLKIIDNNYAHFSGTVSLENYGGFCSIRQKVDQSPYIIDEKSNEFQLRVKGDGKSYNFRVRTPNGRYSYSFTFPTNDNDEWETITIPFREMEANFRGRSIDVPNYQGENILEMRLLIGNKKEESFKILVESIKLN